MLPEIQLTEDSVSVQRKVMRDFTFSNGVKVPCGNFIAVAQHCVLNDARIYPDPNVFDVSRFRKSCTSTRGFTRFTDVSLQFPYWGAPTRPW